MAVHIHRAARATNDLLRALCVVICRVLSHAMNIDYVACSSTMMLDSYMLRVSFVAVCSVTIELVFDTILRPRQQESVNVMYK
jgi:hypothetical protein